MGASRREYSSGRISTLGALIPVIDPDTGDVVLVDDGQGDYTANTGSPVTDSAGRLPGDPLYFPTVTGTPLPDQFVSPGAGYDTQTQADAASALAPGQSTTVKNADGSVLTVRALPAGASAADLPITAALNTLFKVGNALYRQTGALNAAGQPIYAQTSLSGNMFMYAGLAALAYFALAD